MKYQVAVVMGSQSDWTVMKPAVEILKDFGVAAKVEIVSAHRTPEKMQQFALEAKDNGYSVIIAGAGGAAHLPGMIAASTTLPVIGVPVTITSLNGLDALLSIAQMPKGVPVACVAIDGAWNAGLLALKILALGNPKLAKKLAQLKKEQKMKVAKMNQALKLSLKDLKRKPRGSKTRK